MRWPRVLVSLVAVAALATACASPETRARGSTGVLRLGVFPTLTHAPALVGLGAGIFERALAPIRVEVTTYSSGNDAGIALLSGSIDAAYLGPWPTASLYLLSGTVAVVSGVTAGGASLVVRSGAGIDSAEDLHGRRIAVPDINNTQEIALRSWLHGEGLRTREEGGDVAVVGLGGFDLLPLFERDQLDGAWMPEPYPTYLIDAGLADRLVDEESLWPPGELLTTSLVVSTTFMDAHPDVVRALVEANVEAIRFCRTQPERAKAIARSQLVAAGVPALEPQVLDAAWNTLTFTWDPLQRSFDRVVDGAYEVGVLTDPPADVGGIYRLDDLNDLLNDEGLPPVEVAA
jgi:NitT/TauT family transport system substrate-binding protein